MTRTRSRTTSAGVYDDESWIYSYPHGHASRVFVNDETITDDVHKWPAPKSGIGSGDVGGYLQQTKYVCVPGGQFFECHTNWSNPAMSAYNWKAYQFAWSRSQAYLAGHPAPWVKTPAVSDFDLFKAGATAIARCSPTLPHASISQALGEIRRDGIPAIPGLKAFEKGPRPGKKAGSEYLNVEFGIKPLLSDIRKVLTAERKSDRIIAQYVKDSGKLVRRRYEFPATSSTVVEDLGLYAPVSAFTTSMYAVPKGRVTRTTTIERRMWFSGAFTYHVNDADSILGRLHRGSQIANHLTGVGVNPGVLWDLTPWSWAVDWFSNTGDVMTNISSMGTDGLVLVRGYIMAETVTTVTYTNIGAQLWARVGKYPPMSLTQSWTETIRQRRRATPFGFGLSVAAFTPRQLAIVAALGLSRDGRKLAL